MKATIYHKIEGMFFPANGDSVSLDNYKEVGTYEHKRFVSDEHIDDFLDEVYQKTNSIDDHWSYNLGVTGGEGARSTSVGDLIKIDGINSHYEVSSVGFRKVRVL